MVVHPQAEEGQANTKALRGVYLLVEPYNSDANDGDPLDEGRDRIRDWRSCGENRKRDYILGEMHCTIGEKIICDATSLRTGVFVSSYDTAC